jgi:lysophospholipase L1-like esterase
MANDAGHDLCGGNDVNTITSALGRGAGGADQTAYINAQLAAFGEEFSALFRGVRDRAPSARVVLLNLPNMAGLPFLARASRDQRLAAQMLSVGMTRAAFNPLMSSGVTVIDLMCDARSYQPSTYSADGFHPNDAGYAWIAARSWPRRQHTAHPPRLLADGLVQWRAALAPAALTHPMLG